MMKCRNKRFKTQPYVSSHCFQFYYSKLEVCDNFEMVHKDVATRFTYKDSEGKIALLLLLLLLM